MLIQLMIVLTLKSVRHSINLLWRSRNGVASYRQEKGTDQRIKNGKEVIILTGKFNRSVTAVNVAVTKAKYATERCSSHIFVLLYQFSHCIPHDKQLST